MNNSAGITAKIIQPIMGSIVCAVLSIIVIELFGRYP